jgi:cold shock CspA family protein
MVAARTSSLIFLIQVQGFKTLREKQRGAFELRQGSHSKQTANITLQ